MNELTRVLGWVGVGVLGELSAAILSFEGPTRWWFDGLVGVFLLGRLPSGWEVLRLRYRFRRQPLWRLGRSALIRQLDGHPEHRLLGEGFDWTPTHGVLAHRFSEGLGPVRLPEGRSDWLHGLGRRYQPIRQSLAEAEGHTLVIGTTGSGKTRFFDLLIREAILRREAVVIVDPKGDRDLARHAQEMLQSLGRGECFHSFHPGEPEKSVRLDLLRHFNRPSELASRLAAALPGHGVSDPFKAFAVRSLDQVVQGLLYVGERPTLIRIRQLIEQGVGGLLAEALRQHIESVEGPGYRSRLTGKGRDLGAEALHRHYLEGRAAIPKVPAIDGLMALDRHDPTHFAKMVASLLPLLNALTTGPLRALLSPDGAGADDPRRVLDLGRAIRLRHTVYLGLDALSDGPTAGVLGSLIMADLAALAGDRYNHGVPSQRVHLFVDEAAEVINEPTIQLLNKGRGAGFRLTLATQTVADFSARLGSRDRALQVLGNLNTLIAFRVTDPETQRFVTDSLPPIRRPLVSTQESQSQSSDHPSSRNGQRGVQSRDEVAERFPRALLGQLPDLHYLGRLAGGRVVKGRVPIFED